VKTTVHRVIAWGVVVGLAAVLGGGAAAGAAGAPSASFLPAQGTVGQELRLLGTGFASDSEVLVATDPDEEPVTAGHTDSEGFFDVPFTIPDVAPGRHAVIIWVGPDEWEAEYTVVTSAPDPDETEGAVWFEPPAGTVGQRLQLIGLGFPADTDVLVTTSASPDPTLVGRSASDGTFTLAFTIPGLAPGQHPVEVRVGDRQGSLELLVLPAGTGPTPSPTPSDSEEPAAGPSPSIEATTPAAAASGPSAPARSVLARSGAPEVLALVPWGLAALVGALALSAHRSRRRTGA
jgi:hypothetical protein